MVQYDIKHPKCNTTWTEMYESIPEKVACIGCGEVLRVIFEPEILMVRGFRKDERRGHKRVDRRA